MDIISEWTVSYIYANFNNNNNLHISPFSSPLESPSTTATIISIIPLHHLVVPHHNHHEQEY